MLGNLTDNDVKLLSTAEIGKSGLNRELRRQYELAIFIFRSGYYSQPAATYVYFYPDGKIDRDRTNHGKPTETINTLLYKADWVLLVKRGVVLGPEGVNAKRAERRENILHTGSYYTNKSAPEATIMRDYKSSDKNIQKLQKEINKRAL